MFNFLHMYGQIHLAIRGLVLSKFGEELWKKILETANFNETEEFMVFHQYSDERTFALIAAVSEVLDLPRVAVLEAFGEYFFEYCFDHGYDKMLRMLGDNLESFLQNLDSLHSMLAMSYKNVIAPSFRCERDDDGQLILHYYSIRPGLHPIVKGLVPAVGRRLFNTETELELLDVKSEVASMARSWEHVMFRVHIMGNTDDASKTNQSAGRPISSLRTKKSSEKSAERTICLPNTNLVSPMYFCQLFPYHILFDENLKMRQCGLSIQRLCTNLVLEETSLADYFTITHPAMDMTFLNIRKFQQQVYVLKFESRTKKKLDKDFFSLKGQMVFIETIGSMLFLCSPRLSSLNELEEKGIFFSDIPLYDVTRELILLNQQRIAEIEISKQLDETTAKLKKTSKALETEKKKTETLLYQMLPRRVADKLKVGEKVEAEKYDSVTILFSDIVSFTNIAGNSTPMQVISMLNDLYLRFDDLTEKHDVYKVETIGDAYMVVAGIQTQADDHPLRIALLSIDMVSQSSRTKSPVSGENLQIRVGFHTGPVVAGVVGLKMPRYCLFGDTVNTASRMESHSLPGQIHVSPTSHKALKHTECRFEVREKIEVKGKGIMKTYFLLGHGDLSLETDEQTLASNGTDNNITMISNDAQSESKISIHKTRSDVCAIV